MRCSQTCLERRHQPVAYATYGLNDQRISRVALDFAPQAVDLNVDGALADRFIVARKRLPRHRLADIRSEHPQHLALAIGQADRLFALAQLAAGKMENELTEPHR